MGGQRCGAFGVERLARRALLGQMEGEPSADLFDRSYPVFLGLYAEKVSRRSHLFPGVEQGLAWMASQHIHLACVTNKAGRYTIPLLKTLGLYERFAMVLSGDSLSEKKTGPSLAEKKSAQTEPGQV